MAGWDGRGLPPIAADRIARAKRSNLHTSLLSVPAAVAVESAGLDPVGEAMGCVVQQRLPPLVLTPLTFNVDYRPYVRAWREGWDKALSRLREEAGLLGADGVVGIRLTRRPMDDLVEEVVALGTAVRDRSGRHRGRPFATTLPGADVAKLRSGGWTPIDVIAAVAMGGFYRDYSFRQQTSVLAGNGEVDSLTTMVNQARSAVRDDFAQQLRGIHAHGGIVSSMSVETMRIEDSGAGVRADTFGTAIVRTAPAGPAGALTIMPLKGRK
ncbi:heavy metal-binding domain-containing protein [Amycolatopsis sp. GM8]|uniref:heavy metal-binding domain-containing protein n=1 Tax=Amycolatopsis sp. GM8 TaxID=2896530 RepID=UPI001F319099|nr:heavy metal-binding domain-containing protein [Amycolatopsis sp. GM8]